MKTAIYWMTFVGRTCTDLAGPIHELGTAVIQLSDAVGSVYQASSGISVEKTEAATLVDVSTLETNV